MTVVAFDGKTLACDSQLSDGSFAWAETKKIKRVNGWLIGFAGNLDLGTLYMQKFDPAIIESGKNLPALSTTERNDAFEALAISPKGEIYYLETSGIITKLETEGFTAIGCGCSVAMGVMFAGGSAVLAVKAACKYRHGCGGKIHKLRLTCQTSPP